MSSRNHAAGGAPDRVSMERHRVRREPWVAAVGCRTRDEGHVFHIEAFIVPRGRRAPSLKKLEAAEQACKEIDWKVQDIVLVLVSELPEVVAPTPAK